MRLKLHLHHPEAPCWPYTTSTCSSPLFSTIVFRPGISPPIDSYKYWHSVISVAGLITLTQPAITPLQLQWLDSYYKKVRSILGPRAGAAGSLGGAEVVAEEHRAPPSCRHGAVKLPHF